jgi:hypothetical protein
VGEGWALAFQNLVHRTPSLTLPGSLLGIQSRKRFMVSKAGKGRWFFLQLDLKGHFCQKKRMKKWILCKGNTMCNRILHLVKARRKLNVNNLYKPYMLSSQVKSFSPVLNCHFILTSILSSSSTVISPPFSALYFTTLTTTRSYTTWLSTSLGLCVDTYVSVCSISVCLPKFQKCNVFSRDLHF